MVAKAFSRSLTKFARQRRWQVQSIGTRALFQSAASNTKESSSSNLAPLLGGSALFLGALCLKEQGDSFKTTRLEAPPSSNSTISEPGNGDDDDDDDGEETTDVINWSGTHQVSVKSKNLFEPESLEEVEAIVKERHQKGQTIRPLGSSLSPNGIALNQDGMISMVNMDQVLDIDTKNNTITVQAGITVSKAVEALRKHKLTLPNLASIAEQQFGGFVQVSAHGTGRLIAPVDHYVTKLKLVTPALGTITLTKEENGALFELAKVGLGCLGVVVEVTMECIPAHKLVEHTFTLTRQQAREQKDNLLKKHKHMRYMWIPYTDTVVVVTNDPEDQVPKGTPRFQSPAGSNAQKMAPLTNLLAELHGEKGITYDSEVVQGMGFGEVRDALLAFDPLDIDHVKRCNQAEADFWTKNEGYQTQPSDKLLQFDCGGQQWVFEVCFPTGTIETNNDNDTKFMEQLLEGIEKNGIPAHSPIEQRWSAASSSTMSPAHGPEDGLFCWIGIINYLPSDDLDQRNAITNLFTGSYSDLVRKVGRPVQMVSHWAKLEEPRSVTKAVDMKMIYQDRYPVTEFNRARALFDPKNILSNKLLDLVFGVPKES
ncbi:unnamed protein product [Cylindrotheca closterium]|uniref:FAD-binding PCMH-type domain-containing protein n=1 Tax=Cylindrotheca closterium TaxID=2856 RepID=A0AAD2GA80_9STRA|nr:unnamed protein product [Cylindrotheca closterium]